MKLSRKLISMIMSTVLAISIPIHSLAAIPEYGEEYRNQPTTQYKKVFIDVPKSYWAFDYIMEMVNREVLSGYPNGYFYPDNTITRAEFSKIMCVASNITVNKVNSTTYKDVKPTDWYASYVEAGKHYLSGYISDGEKYYLPEQNALREDIAVALVKLKGYDTSIYDESVLKAMFTDYKSISEDARKYVSVAVENGLISGYDDNTFRGQNTVTRAEAATLLWRAYQYGNGNKVFDKEILDIQEQPVTPEVLYPDTNNSDDEIIIDEQKDPEPEKEYLYELKTIGSNVPGVEYMIATDNGAFYLYKHNIYEVSKDGNSVKILVDKNNIEYLGDEEISKSEKNNIINRIYYIGYDPLLNKRYCIIEQNIGGAYLYDIDSKEYVNIKNLLISDQVTYDPTVRDSVKRFLINEFGHIVIGGTCLDYVNNIVIPVKYKTDEYGMYCSQLFANNTIYATHGTYIYPYNKRTGTVDEKLDYDIPGREKLIGADNKNFYFTTDENIIYTVDIDGNSRILCGIDDIDNTDGKIINIGVMDYLTSSISPDGVIYYWDTNYNCIRQLDHK